jgi:hypothetical protein
VLPRLAGIDLPVYFIWPKMYSFAVAITIATVSLAFSALGQESIRTPEVPLFHTFLPNPAQTSFLRLGPFSGTGGVVVGYTFNDDADTSEITKLSRNQVFESLDFDLVWTLSPFNRIELALDGELQENFYSNGKQTLNLLIRPSSQIDFQAKVGDVLLHAIEQFAIVQDPTSDPAISGQTNLNRLTNTVGLSALWPLHPVELGLAFDYTYSDVLSGGGGIGTAAPGVEGQRNSFRLGGTLGFEISPSLSYGLEVNATTNSGSNSPDINSFSVGPFIRGHLTSLIEADCGVGVLLIDAPGISPTQYYAYLSVRHQLSQISQVLLGISHDFEFSTGLDVTENNNFHLRGQVNLTRQWMVTVGPFVNFGRVISGFTPGSYTQYGVSVDSIFRFSNRLSADIGYRFTQRDSGVALGKYTQNVVNISVSYAF